jgi:hypothetical protein
MSHVRINDVWEKYTVKFQIFDPIIDSRGQMSLLVGGHDQYVQEHKMSLSKYPKEWLKVKYGRNITPWEVSI